jgi:hypothetical protein
MFRVYETNDFVHEEKKTEHEMDKIKYSCRELKALRNSGMTSLQNVMNNEGKKSKYHIKEGNVTTFRTKHFKVSLRNSEG